MFTVTALRIGKCMACGKETDCFEVEAKKQLLSGLFCMSDFKRQVKIFTPNSEPESTPPSTTSSSS